MKARVKETGEIVEVKIIDQLSEEEMYVEKFGEMSGRVFHITELDFDNLDNPDYWTRLEHTYAGMAMQGILSNEAMQLELMRVFGKEECIEDIIVDYAKDMALLLVRKMKEERK